MMNKNKIVPKLADNIDDHIKITGYLSDLETIRVNQFQIIQEVKSTVGSLSTSSERIDFNQFEPGFVYIITQITAIEIGTGTPQVKIGANLGATDVIWETGTVGNAEDTVSFVGQVFLKETDQVFVIFENAASGDTIRVFMNGYKIRR